MSRGRQVRSSAIEKLTNTETEAVARQNFFFLIEVYYGNHLFLRNYFSLVENHPRREPI